MITEGARAYQEWEPNYLHPGDYGASSYAVEVLVRRVLEASLTECAKDRAPSKNRLMRKS